MSVSLKLDVIQFPAVQVPSADVNALDDYEEGVWTPMFLSSAAVFTQSGSGYYTKIGNVVYYTGYVALSALPSGTTSNALFITGLPFNVNATANRFAAAHFGPSQYVNVPANAVLSGYASLGTNTITLNFFNSNAAATSVTAASLTNSGATMMVSGFYHV